MESKFAETLWSSKKHDYNTPLWLFEKLNKHYEFETDPATNSENPLGCKTYFTPKEDGLSWERWNGPVFINPPYDRKVQHLWVYEANKYSYNTMRTVVMLLPARQDTRLWQNFIFPEADLICFIKGRLKFSGHENAAPFGSALVVFHSYPYQMIKDDEKQLYKDIGRIIRCDYS